MTFRPKGEVRRSGESQDEIYRRRLDSVQQRAEAISVGTSRILSLVPYKQESNDTCLLACAISARKSWLIARNRRLLTPEATISSEARNRGLLAQGGMFGNQTDQDFLKEMLGVSILDRRIGEDSIANGVFDAIQGGNIGFLNHSLVQLGTG